MFYPWHTRIHKNVYEDVPQLLVNLLQRENTPAVLATQERREIGISSGGL